MKKIYIAILGTLGLFLTITGITFAFFLLSESQNELETDVTGADLTLLGLELVGGQEVTIPEGGIYPGWIGLQKFNVNKLVDITEGTGAYKVVMTTDIDPAYQQWISIEVYKTTDSGKTIERIEGDFAVNPNDPSQVFITDNVTSDDFAMPENAIFDEVIDSTTPKVTLDKQTYDLTTFKNTTYFVVYYFENTSENQNDTLAKTFNTKISIEQAPDVSLLDDFQAPVLSTGLIPVSIEEGTGIVRVQDLTKEWYDYPDKKWANAVTVTEANSSLRTAEPGTIIPMTAIHQMYVWIPRYQYDIDSIIDASKAIDIDFVDTETLSHPAFCFGNSCQSDRNDPENIELPGLWVGKFEQGTDNTIRPDQNSMNSKTVYQLYDNINNINSTNGLDTNTDIHMIKNLEWGAITYFTQSIYGVCNSDGTCTDTEGNNLKVENNNYYLETSYNIITGCGGDDTSRIGTCPTTNRWNTANGVEASTTHNITGIYDMSGGRWEYVMGVMETSGGLWDPGSSGFTEVPEKKHYDSYPYSSTYNDSTAYARGLYGDATIELKPSNDSKPTDGLMNNWNNTRAYYIYDLHNWFMRGGSAFDSQMSGIFAFSHYSGTTHGNRTSRSIAVPLGGSTTP